MIFRFADCNLDPDRQVLTRQGKTVSVEPQVFALLQLLVENPDRLVTRDEIVDTVWNGRVISESAISARIAAARRAVGDDGKKQRVIRTVSRRGLRLAVPVEQNQASVGAHGTSVTKARYCTADDGASLAYVIGGQGPPVAGIVHNFTDIEREPYWPGLGEEWQAVMAQNTLLRYDPRGSGLSRQTVKSFDLDEWAEDLRAVLDAAGLEKVAIHAKTAGALVALTFAARHPNRVSRMVLTGGYVDGRVRRSGAPHVADPIRGLLAEGWDDPNAVFVSAYMSAYFPDGPDHVVRNLAAYAQGNATREFIVRWRDVFDRASVANLLPLIDCPVLVIHARHDRIHPLSEAQKLAAGISRSELLVLESGNHFPLYGDPGWDIYLSAMLNFLREP
ncbi:alpha/beta fold hydrolase [Aestuariivita boseongensis]|uniref:alpha/beta fold hydrolase n=1 Tax=Aestuariivita boseongensis TaxID=1470562 RepID=UPI000681242B|nr:alpha/beta fold hydrolase [Aestuariivita boseongensis]